MKVVIQRVSEASVTVNKIVTGKINAGLLVLIGFEETDTQVDIAWMSGKITRLRIFGDDNENMNLSVSDVGGEILLISQFTLHASTKKGNRPSFIKAAKPNLAISLYEQFIQQLEIDLGKPIQTGEFGADMKVALINNGPVTITIDSKNKE